MPPRFVTFVQEFEEAINMQLEADSEQLDYSLRMLLRLPDLSILKFMFRLELMLSGIERDSERAAHRFDEFDDFTINLNRFESVEDFMDSLVSQLDSFTAQTLRHDTLEVRYHQEPATGPGPVKEFFEVCRGLFSVYPMPEQHEHTDAGSGQAEGETKTDGDAMRTPERPTRRQQPNATARKRRNEEKTSKRHSIAECMPLFVPAGTCFDGTFRNVHAVQARVVRSWDIHARMS